MSKKNDDRISQFCSCETLATIVDCVRSFGPYHHTYCWYTSLDRVLQMMDPTTPRLWLTRLDAGLFDDGIEHEKYGLKSEREKTYIRSFMYGSQESAAMWGLYCQPTYKAIRMNITQKAMKLLLGRKVYKTNDKGNKGEECKVEECMITDLLYASVENEEEKGTRVNKLYWNGVYSKTLANLKNEKGRRYATGMVKDAEWRFENECRLIYKAAKNYGDHIAVDVPKKFYEGVSFVLSPWASDDEQLFVRQQLLCRFKNVGRKVRVDDKKVFQRSKLAHGLQKWAENRGLL